MRRPFLMLALGLGLLTAGCQHCVRHCRSGPVRTDPPPAPASRPAAALTEPLPPWGEPAAVPDPLGTPEIAAAAVEPPPVATEPTSTGPGHAPDYRWLVGRLHYVHVRDVWLIRYAAPESDDRYGGLLTLVDSGAMSAFRSGQLVRVEGRVIDPDSREPRPAYQVRSLQPVP